MDPEIDSLANSFPKSFDKFVQTNDIPSAAERKHFHDAFAAPEAALQALRAEISQLNDRLTILIEKEKRLSQTLKPYQATLSPFRNLPDDILREIFIACLPAQHNPLITAPEAPILLSHISRHTRHVAVSTPRLWAAMHVPIVNDDRLMQNRSRVVEDWLLNRSGACDLNISVHENSSSWQTASSDAYVKDILREIVASSKWWKNISLTCCISSFRYFFPVFSNLSTFPRLESFSLKIRSYVPFGNNVAYDSSALARAACLKDVRLYTWSSDGTYRSYNVRWDRLTHLTLGSRMTPINTVCASAILGQATQLYTCKLYLVDMRNECMPLLSLPHLTGISLAFENEWEWWDSPASLDLFGRMSLPVLEHITYDASNGFKPLLGLLRGAKGRITHLYVSNIDGPLDLIECLQHCPRLVALDLFSLGETLELRGNGGALRAWYNFIGQPFDVGAYLLPAFTPPDIASSPARVPPERLCPKLEYLSIRDPELIVDAEELREFVAAKFSLSDAAVCEGYSMLKGLCLDILSESTDDVMSLDDFADEIHAGLKLSLKYTPWRNNLPTYPPNDGIFVKKGRPNWWPGSGEPEH